MPGERTGKRRLDDTEVDKNTEFPKREKVQVKVNGRIFELNGVKLKKKCMTFYCYLNYKSQLQQGDDNYILLEEVDPDVFADIHSILENNDIASDSRNESWLVEVVQAAETLHAVYIINFFIHHSGCEVNPENSLGKACLDYVKRNFVSFLNSDYFVSLPENMLKKILGFDRVGVSEDDVVSALFKWAKRECIRRHIRVDFKNQILMLRGIKHLIKYPRMRTKYFMQEIFGSGLLSNDERIEALCFFLPRSLVINIDQPHHQTHYIHPNRFRFTTSQGNVLGNVQNDQVFPVHRFQGVNSGKSYVRDREDHLSFICNKDVILRGILVFGSHQMETVYTIRLEVLDNLNRIFLIDDYHLPTDGHARIYKIDINNTGLRLRKAHVYTIRMRMKGIASYYGILGISQVTFNGVTVTFRTDINGLNGTSDKCGQFPGLLLQRC